MFVMLGRLSMVRCLTKRATVWTVIYLIILISMNLIGRRNALRLYTNSIHHLNLSASWRIVELANCLIAQLTFVGRRNALRLYHNSIHHLNCRIAELAHRLIVELTFVARRNALRLYTGPIHNLNWHIGILPQLLNANAVACNGPTILAFYTFSINYDGRCNILCIRTCHPLTFNG